MFSANQKAFVICTRVTSLHSCYTFCTRVTEELHSFLSQSELSNFFVYIIIELIFHAELMMYDATLLTELCRIGFEFMLTLISLNNFPVPIR